ncbi:MAG: glycosyltransferase family 39 protein [Anaerolineae bacterium]|nr:glycosyltransferase family 39 protein [Anaerolineae bacterium]
MSERAARRVLALIVALYLLLGLAYSIANPILESPDEELNYENIRYLVTQRKLPVLTADEATKAHHPPLYYVAAALLTFWTPNENFEAIAGRINPFWAYRLWESGVDNKCIYLHDPELEDLPYRDAALGIHLVRWFSLLLGAGTVLLVYATARELFRARPALAVGAAALVAFNPMFIYISGSVHDDPLANLVAAGLLFTTTRFLVRGPTTRRAAAIGFMAGLGIVTKLTCLLVAPAAALALLWRPLANRGRAGWREAARLGLIAAATALLVGGWWLARNTFLYGEPTSMGIQVEAWGGTRPNAPNLAAAIGELGFLHDSAWGAFGYGQVPMPFWVYALARMLGLGALGGLVLWGARWRSGRSKPVFPLAVPLILLAAPLATLGVVLARMTIIDSANFGRYLFVSLAAVAPFYALGVGEWFPARQRWRAMTGLSVLSFCLAVYALVAVLRPAYAPPPLLSPTQVAARSEPADVRFGDAIRLAGYRLERNRALPGQVVEVTLCWEARDEMAENYAYFVHFLGSQQRIVGARDTHPGLSRYPTRRWSPGDLFCDQVGVPVAEWAPTRAVYGVEVGWYDPASGERLPAYDANGAPLGLVLLDRLKVLPTAYPAVEVPHRLDANLGDQVTLLGYALSQDTICPAQPLTVTLYWAAQAPPPADYTVFLHLTTPDAPPHAQADGQPQNGAYPTSFWDVGEVVTDVRVLSIPADLPAGDYSLLAGMYLLETGQRLPWLAADRTVQGDAVPVATVSIRPTAP